MNELIEAFTIFAKYLPTGNHTMCTHDTLWVCLDPLGVSTEDTQRLQTLGFTAALDDEAFISYRHGSC